jgi:hypothetical protein
MKRQVILILSFALFGVCNSLFAQENPLKNLKHTLVVGYPTQILSGSTKAIYLAYNPYLQIAQKISLEGQFGFSRMNYRAFISGYHGRLNFGTAHIGVRLHQKNSEKKLKPYFNLLGGLSSGVSTIHVGQYNQESKPYTNLSISTGLFLAYGRRIAAGVSLESNHEPLVIFKFIYKV